MTRVGKAIAYGAVTIVNAISCGLGAALGVKLWTEATVKLTDEPSVIEGKIISDPTENTELIVETVKRVLKHLALENEYGAYVETRSNIPIARGLKSSSTAANAVALATFDALEENVEDLMIVNLGVDAAIDANVTVTGAFDDACASYFGNIIVSDNNSRKILKSFDVEKGEDNVLIYVPTEKSYTADSDVERIRMIAREVRTICKEALAGNYWTAMTLNGLVHSTVLGYNSKIALDAIMNGAIAAGLSGKGPAVAAIARSENIEDVLRVWQQYNGTIIKTEVNREKAHVLR
jgi:shikimate kinase